MQVGNQTFHGASDDYVKATILSMADLWSKACMAYFDNDEGKAIYTRLNKNKNPQSNNAVIPFGPWIIWSKDDWEDVDYNYGRWRRLQKRNKDADDSKSIISTDISPSQKDRGRKERGNKQSDDRARSRSRSRKSTSSNTQQKHNHKKTSSNLSPNDKPSSDGADSEDDIV